MKKEVLELKIANIKELLFEKSFLQLFTEELIKNKLSLLQRSDRFNDATDKSGNRYEIKGTVVRDKGDNYRTNKSTYTCEQISSFMNNSTYFLNINKNICSYARSKEVRFVSIFNKFEFSKFDIFIGVVYFDDVIKIVSFTRDELISTGKTSRQFSDDVFSLSLDRNNIMEFIESGLVLTLKYEDIFSE